MNASVITMDRRGLLKLAGSGLALAVGASGQVVRAQAPDAPRKYGGDAMPGGTVDNPLVFVSIAADGTVTIVARVWPAPEMLSTDARGRGCPVGWTVMKPGPVVPVAVRLIDTATASSGAVVVKVMRTRPGAPSTGVRPATVSGAGRSSNRSAT